MRTLRFGLFLLFALLSVTTLAAAQRFSMVVNLNYSTQTTVIKKDGKNRWLCQTEVNPKTFLFKNIELNEFEATVSKLPKLAKNQPCPEYVSFGNSVRTCLNEPETRKFVARIDELCRR